MRHSVLFVLLLACVTYSCKTSSTAKTTPIPDGIIFSSETKFEDIFAQAKAENKLVFVDFYADWCMPCKMMDKEVFSDKEIGDFFNKKFINVKVDAEKMNGPDLAAIFEVKGFPTMLFLDEIVRVVERREGAAFHTDLMNLAQSALSYKESMTYLTHPQD